MTLARAKSAERRVRLARGGLAAAGFLVGLTTGAGAGYAATLGHREFVAAFYGFDIFSKPDWQRLHQQWRSGRFSLDTPRRWQFAGSLVLGAAFAGAAAAGGFKAGQRVAQSSFDRLGRAIAARRRSQGGMLSPVSAAASAPGSAINAPAAGAALPARHSGPASAEGSVSARVEDILSAADPADRARWNAKLDATIEASRDTVLANTKAEYDQVAQAHAAAIAGIDASPEGATAPPAAPNAAASPAPTSPARVAPTPPIESRTPAERAATLERIRLCALTCGGRVFDGAAMGVDLAVLIGNQFRLVRVFDREGEWEPHDTRSPSIWHDSLSGIDLASPVEELGDLLDAAREKLGGRLEDLDFTVSGWLCLDGRARLISQDLRGWSLFDVQVLDGSLAQTCGEVESALEVGTQLAAHEWHEQGNADSYPAAVADALEAFLAETPVSS